ETVREPSGLAISSRNMYLDEGERARAAAMHRGLGRARAAFGSGERDPGRLAALIRAEIDAAAPTRIDHVEIVSQANLQPLVHQVDEPAVMAVAVFYGTTRLIDNELLG